jgi:hypothetical protein
MDNLSKFKGWLFTWLNCINTSDAAVTFPREISQLGDSGKSGEMHNTAKDGTNVIPAK